MFSPYAHDFQKFIEFAFIAGASQDNIKSFISNGDNSNMYPECLLAFPDKKEIITSGVLEFVFPTGFQLVYSEQTPKFVSITLTNERGIRYYIYALKVFEQLDHGIFNSGGVTKPSLENMKKMSLMRSKTIKTVYAPIAICVWSYINNTDTFKEILHESYRIITYNNKEKNVNMVENFRYLELLNYFSFLDSIVKPPPFTKLTLNFSYSSVAFYSSSNYELPVADSNMKILFSCLEISIIIKLWCGLLSEKHTIIIANQAFLLYSVCEALIKLLFPFKWLHSYIPVLPNNKLDFLEAPTPYLMGVLSSSVDYDSLKEDYPDHIICNVDTSQIYSDCFIGLPQNEETKLRKKLQFVKNPEIFDVEEIITNNKRNVTAIEDISSDRTFPENVQYIFFRIIRNALTGFNKKYMNGNIFESDLFFEDFSSQSEEHRIFWDKIIKTMAFEYFIMSDEYLENSNTKIFKNVVKCKDEKFVLNDYYSYETSINRENISEILDELFDKADLNEEEKSTNKFSIFLKDFNTIAEIGVTGILKKVKRNKELLITSEFEGLKTSETSPHILKSDGKINITPPNILTQNKTVSRRLTFDFMAMNKLSGDDSSQSALKNSLKEEYQDFLKFWIKNREKDNECLYFYSKSDKLGFLTFINNLNEFRINNNIKKDLIKLGIKKHLKKLFLPFIEYNKNNENKFETKENSNPIDHKKINKNEINNLNDEELIKLGCNTNFRYSFGVSFMQTFVNPYKTNNTNLKIDIDDVLEIEASDNFQYFLLIAFHLEELYLKKGISKVIINTILNLYEKAYYASDKEFPQYRYYELINKYCELNELEFLKSKLSEQYVNKETKKSKDLLLNIIELNIDKIRKHNEKILIEEGRRKTEFDIRNSCYSKSSGKSESSNNSSGLSPSSTPGSNTSKTLESPDKLSRKVVMTPRPSDNSKISFFKLMLKSAHKDMKDIKRNSNELKEEKRKSDDKVTIPENYRSNDKKVSFIIPEEKNIVDSSYISTISDNLDQSKPILRKMMFQCESDPMKLINSNKPLSNNIKRIIINSFFKVGKTNKDALSVAEEVCFKVYAVFNKFSLNKIMNDAITPKLLHEISNSHEFNSLKESVCELQKVNIAKFSNEKNKICFWLNIFNFLTIFTVIYKNEIVSSQYEWTRVLMHSYFNIGGYELSLFEIENRILTNNMYSKAMYGEVSNFSQTENHKNKLIIDPNSDKNNKNIYITFGVAIPTLSAPQLRIYFADKLTDSLKKNCIDYCSKHLVLDENSGCISIPEYILWNDCKFLDQVENYKEILDKKIYEYLLKHKKEKKIIKKVTKKYLWKSSFSNILTWELYNK